MSYVLTDVSVSSHLQLWLFFSFPVGILQCVPRSASTELGLLASNPKHCFQCKPIRSNEGIRSLSELHLSSKSTAAYLSVIR